MRSGCAAGFFDDEDAAGSREDFVARDLVLGGMQLR